MSLASWKKVYFSKHGTMPTFQAKPKRLHPATVRRAIEHSLLKWEGLREKNLEAHAVSGNFCSIEDEKYYLDIDGGSCALCKVFAGRNRWAANDDNIPFCSGCPLYVALGNKPCDGSGSPYDEFINNNDPEPMIKALKKAMKQNTEGAE